MANKAKRKLTRAARARPASQRPGKVYNAAERLNSNEWSNISVVTLVEQRTCTSCRRTYDCPAPTLMMEQRHKTLRNSQRLTPLSPSVAHPDPLLPHSIRHLSVSIPRCHRCTREHNAQSELFPEARYLGVQGQRPPRAPEPNAPTKPKVKPIPDDFF